MIFFRKSVSTFRDHAVAPRRFAATRARGLVLAGIAAVLVAALGVAVSLFLRSSSPPISTTIGGPFALSASDGTRVTDRDFLGKWLLVYFGYTSCPDICPTTLAEISQTLDLLGNAATRVQPLFITIDPERDSPEVIGAYARSIDTRIVGLSGDAAEIASVAKAYRVYYAKKALPSATDSSYLMDHTAFVYVMGPDGKYVTLFSPVQGQTPDDMAARLRDMIGGPTHD
jgi:protein SCO1/2